MPDRRIYVNYCDGLDAVGNPSCGICRNYAALPLVQTSSCYTCYRLAALPLLAFSTFSHRARLLSLSLEDSFDALPALLYSPRSNVLALSIGLPTLWPRRHWQLLVFAGDGHSRARGAV